MLSDPSSDSRPDRRAFLRAGLYTAAGAPLLASALAACGTGYSTEPDPLLPLLSAARADHTAAGRLAQANSADAIARVRGAHAKALHAEIERLNRPRPDHRETSEPRINNIADFAARLTHAREQATSLVPELPQYRAGLVASVAAGCAGLQQLSDELAPPESGDEPTTRITADDASGLADEALQALREALHAEYAARWVYGLVTAYLPAAFDGSVARAREAHRETADATRALLTAAKADPEPAEPAEPAYRPEQPVRDSEDAMRLVITAEQDVARTWRGVLVRTDDPGLRTSATHTLVATAARATPWRAEVGTDPVAVALPGKP